MAERPLTFPPRRSLPLPVRGERVRMKVPLFMADGLSDDLEKRPVEAVIFGARQKVWADSVRFEHAAQHAFRGFTLVLEAEQLLGGDRVTLHSNDLHDVRD